MPSNDFSLQDLYAALDAQRQERGYSWTRATREMAQHGKRHPLSPSTVKGMRTRAVAEADGVLAMLRWLGRSPESFLQGHETSERSGRLPDIPSGKVLRFDTTKIYAALDARRLERKMTWAQVAEGVGLGVSSLTRLAKGGRTAFPGVMRIMRWLGEPSARFMRASDS